MNQEIPRSLTILKWTMLTWTGWLTGITLGIGFGTLIEIIGIEKGGLCVTGIGIGVGVGFMQWLALKKYLMKSSQNWIWFSVLGFGITFIILDIFESQTNISSHYFSNFATTAGSLITSWLQYKYILCKISSNSKSWIAYNFIAWGISDLLTISPFLFGTTGITGIISFLLLSLGGPVLGLISGKSIVSILSNRTDRKLEI